MGRVQVIAHCACGADITIVDTGTWRIHEIRSCRTCAPNNKQRKERLAYLQKLENRALGAGKLSTSTKAALKLVQAEIAELAKDERLERKLRAPDVIVTLDDGSVHELVSDLGREMLDEFELPVLKCDHCGTTFDVGRHYCAECYEKRIDPAEHERLKTELADVRKDVATLEEEVERLKKG